MRKRGAIARVTNVAWFSWDCLVLELEVSDETSLSHHRQGDPLCPGTVGHSSEP